jgi:hypothetical protein
MARLLWRYNALTITPASNGKKERRSGERFCDPQIRLELGKRADRAIGDPLRE